MAFPGEAAGADRPCACEQCEYRTTGREQYCHQRKITGEYVDGGYAQYVLSNAAHTYHVPQALDLAEVAPLFCPGITAYGAVQKLDLGPGSTWRSSGSAAWATWRCSSPGSLART
ncbi:alcohol dehydrogenase catalytic domain-containing protein [Streptomyces odonnellii]|uniref:alcohol dehydrogenase catalytic domain-containing protein n=1 Tax=Streptomyces odonnellii TaxID=1417980 RepID=UPI00099C859F|nr:alcohol dehydrogenase catalytic domain-containing protein [Streptomyces odonnellii]